MIGCFSLMKKFRFLQIKRNFPVDCPLIKSVKILLYTIYGSPFLQMNGGIHKMILQTSHVVDHQLLHIGICLKQSSLTNLINLLECHNNQVYKIDDDVILYQILWKSPVIWHQFAYHCLNFEQNHWQLVLVGSHMSLTGKSHVVGCIKYYDE